MSLEDTEPLPAAFHGRGLDSLGQKLSCNPCNTPKTVGVLGSGFRVVPVTLIAYTF